MSGMSSKQGVLSQLLQSRGLSTEAVDEAVSEYVINALDDMDDEDLVEVLLCYVPEAADALSRDQQLRLVAELRARVKEPDEPEVQSAAAAAVEAVECVSEQKSEEFKVAQEQPSEEDAAVAANDENDPLAEDVQFLVGLVPEAEAAVARYVLQIISANNRTHAAQYLVEHSSSEGLQRLKSAKVRRVRQLCCCVSCVVANAHDPDAPHLPRRCCFVHQEAYEDQQRKRQQEEEEKVWALRKNMLEKYADVDVAEANRTHRPVVLTTSTKQKIRYGRCSP